ncbi:MAG: glycosyltransferase, partial [Clostridia bacterium]
GDWQYEQFLRDKQWQYPSNLSVNIAFNADLAQKIYAASDIFLMPSLSEPCGLAQMIALRYGSIPIVRETGGLRDTVTPYNKFTGEGRGFTFHDYNAHDMLYVIREAEETYADKEAWSALSLAGMKIDFSWKKSAKEYKSLYEALII